MQQEACSVGTWGMQNEKRGRYSHRSWDLLRVFPSTPRPPYTKSVWSDTGVMVCIERPSGAQVEGMSLFNIQFITGLKWMNKNEASMKTREEGLTTESRSRSPGLSRTCPTLLPPVNNQKLSFRREQSYTQQMWASVTDGKHHSVFINTSSIPKYHNCAVSPEHRGS